MKKFNLLGEEIGKIGVDEGLLQKDVNSQMIKDYIVALRANQRQWSANTKTRAEVSHSGQKPHPQKGTGRARQGYLGAPQYKGGGVVGGPRPKFDQHVRINRKEKRAAIRHLFAEKIKSDALVVLENPLFQKPRTKSLADFLKGLGVFGKKVLFVAEKKAEGSGVHFTKSMSNIPNADFMLLANISGYDIASHRFVILLESAVSHLIKILEG
jgi:large subunit ribosomal protein L4